MGVGALSEPNRRTLYFFLRYIAIGGVVFCVQVGSFKFMLEAVNLAPALPRASYLLGAGTLSYGLALLCHFSLNRILNFRNFERSPLQQAQTYGVIVFFQWLLTLAVIQLGTACGLNPVYAVIASIAINLPIGFLSHRHLTFGPGILATVRKLRSASK